ncbi:LOW QUALITY PROTEIN: kinase-like domain-containing protein, partial [Endogone sp. FLAS-F59071]
MPEALDFKSLHEISNSKLNLLPQLLETYYHLRDMTDYSTYLGYVDNLGITSYDLEQIDCNFADANHLGRGVFITAYKGFLRKDPWDLESIVPVAIKIPTTEMLLETRDRKTYSLLSKELHIIQHLSEHPNIINLHGVSFKDLKPILLVELAVSTLDIYLDKRKMGGDPVDWVTKARFCCDVADGLVALHSVKAVHGDVKGDNILLFENDSVGLLAK